MKLNMMRRLPSGNLASSFLLFFAAILAGIVANSSLAPFYNDFLSQELHLRIGDFNLLSHGVRNLTMIEFINDGLMSLFFFSVGLEIKREVLVGQLSSFRKAILPFIAACGGMIVPVLIYSFICDPSTVPGQGLAIPMATDIAFSLGVLSLLGTRVPLSLKVFLVAFAVVDDIGGILVIALYYTSHVTWEYIAIALLLIFFLYYLVKYRVIDKLFFFIIAIMVWYLFLQSGIHSTVAGVLIAFITPAKPQMNVGKYIEYIRTLISTFPSYNEEDEKPQVLTNVQIAKLKAVEAASNRVISPLQDLEDNLHSAVNFIILPLFAFVNAGVVFQGEGELLGPVSIAVILGLLVGKFIGIFSFTFFSIKSGIAAMPKGVNWKSIAGVSLLGGIGFTVSLFVADLSFGTTHPLFLNQAKFGVLCGTIISGILGYMVLKRVLPPKAEE